MKRAILILILTAVTVWAAAAAMGLRTLGHLVKQTRNGAAPQPGSAPGQDDRPGLLEPESAAIRKGAPAGYRPATAADCEETQEREDLENLYVTYEPYFVRGDVNSDGVLDLAVAYVSGGETPVYDVAVLFGKRGGGFSDPMFVERGTALAFGDLSIDRSIVVVTPDLSTEVTRRYRYNAKQGSFEDVDAGFEERPGRERQDDAPEEAPDHRLRTRT